MILVLQVDKIEPGVYRAVLRDGTEEVVEATMHPNLAAALQATAEWTPPEVARFLEPRFAGCTTGTVSCADLARDAGEVANRLVSIAAIVARGHSG